MPSRRNVSNEALNVQFVCASVNAREFRKTLRSACTSLKADAFNTVYCLPEGAISWQCLAMHWRSCAAPGPHSPNHFPTLHGLQYRVASVEPHIPHLVLAFLGAFLPRSAACFSSHPPSCRRSGSPWTARSDADDCYPPRTGTLRP